MSKRTSFGVFCRPFHRRASPPLNGQVPEVQAVAGRRVVRARSRSSPGSSAVGVPSVRGIHNEAHGLDAHAMGES